MKKKKLILFTFVLFLCSGIYAQQPKTGTAQSTITPWNPTNSSFAWFRGGNTSAGGGGIDNVFGTQWNSPIYTITNNVVRTRLNGTLNAPINNVLQNVDGYFGIGRNNYFQTNSPWSMLHLEGNNNSAFGGNGWRSWMNTGLFMKENSDNMYIGMKQEFNAFTGTNYSDAVVSWGDDALQTLGGPDDLRFIFTGAANGTGTCTSCPTVASGLDGLEIMRMISNGNVGIGPVFSKIPTAGNLQPQSLLHLNTPSALSAWMQFSNQTSTGQAATDGIRIGLLGSAIAAENGNAYFYNQETRSILFSTGYTTPNNFTISRERMRITSIAAPTQLPSGLVGVYNPGAIANTDLTRVAISHNPQFPVTRPLSLLHLGYNAGAIPGITDGWRSWMDVGMFVSQGSDHLYLGMKDAGAPDRFDAVIGWGDNQSNTPSTNIAPDNLRFIFTAPTAAIIPSTAPANGVDGIEAMRMTPNFTTPSTINVGVGGDPAVNLYSTGSPNPQNTFEINSPAQVIGAANTGLRFTDLNSTATPATNPGTGVLSVDANGDVIYVTGGTTVPTFGGACGNTNNMTADFAIPMNGNNYIFSGQGTTGYNVGIGFANGFCSPIAKLDVRQVSTVASSIGIATVNADTNGFAITARSIGQATGTQTKVAGYFQSTPSFGSQQVAIYVPSNGGVVNIGYPSSNSGQNQLLNVNGTISLSAIPVITSDANVKINVNSINSAYSIVNRLRPVSYEYVQSFINDTTMYGTHYGFIAQEVDTVLPAVVHTNNNGQKSIAYTEILPYLVQALKEQSALNDSLLNRISLLETTVTGCCTQNARSSASASTSSVVLTDITSIVLNQNIPNPFAEQTTITFELPTTVKRAQVLFYDAQGKLIKAVEIDERGQGQLTVFANDLSNGVYSYALVADGQIVDSKKMMKQD
jgi:Chaperone of endosialidase